MKPDDICEKYNPADVNIAISYKNNMVFLEGNEKSLRFLGDLIIAQASYTKDCGFQLSPDGAGGAFFDDSSSIGLYIHRLPCHDSPETENA